MEKDKLEPKLRFPGFTEPWEQRKLASLATMNARIGWQNLRTSEFLDSGDYLLITGVDFKSGGVDLEHCKFVDERRYEQDKKIQLSEGSILLTKDGTLGKVAFIKSLPKPATLNAGVFNIRVINPEKLSPKFLYIYLSGPFLMDYVAKTSTGGTIQHLNQSVLRDFLVPYPKFEEQEKISSILDGVNQIITLHQRKEEELQKLKKGLLQKMFPKDGESVPEVRFPNFTDSWEQRKLGDIARFVNGRAYKQDELLSKGKYPILRVGNFYTNDAWYYSDLELDEKLYAKEGDLLYTWSATFGPHIWNGSKVIYHYHIWKVILSDKLEPSFALWLLEADKNHLLSGSNGSTMIHITKAGMENKEVAIPRSLSEQKNIGEFLNNLKQLITLHQRKTEELKKLKKALLQQMFV